MKYFSILFFGLSVACSSLAMEEVHQEIIPIDYKGPHFNTNGNLYQICAYNKNQMIGYITYSQNKITKRWELRSLSVTKPFRRLDIATKLFNDCIEHLHSNGFNQLDVEIVSLDTGISFEELEKIYQKIVESLMVNKAQLLLGKTYGNSLVKMRIATLTWNKA